MSAEWAAERGDETFGIGFREMIVLWLRSGKSRHFAFGLRDSYRPPLAVWIIAP
jgi:hypothetical protein